MYLLYLDDAGSPGNVSEEYFVLGGICVYEAQADWFTREIDKLAAAFNPTSPEDVEFHASTIFSRREGPWKNFAIEDASGALKGVLQIVRSSYSTTRLFACAIHKKSYPNQDPVELAFEDLCQRFDLFLARQRQAGDPQRGLLILDKTTRETTLQRLSREFRKVGTKWACYGTSPTPRCLWTPEPRGSCRSPIMWHMPYSGVTTQATPNTLTSLPLASTRQTA